jgi:hypothetical protein
MKNLIYIKILAVIICLFLFSCNNIATQNTATQNTTQSPNNEIIDMMGDIDSLTEGVFVSGNLNESIDGSYCIEINKTYQLFLNLDSANRYSIEIEREPDLGSDMLFIDAISFGYYKMDSNVLLLEDLNLKMKMTFCKENDSTLTCVKGFEYLKGKAMIYHHTSQINTWLFDEYKFDIQKKRKQFIVNKNRDIDIYGSYCNLSSNRISREICIYKDSSYEFFMHNMLCSKGSYTISSNEITLYDDVFECRFYVYFTEKGHLQGELLPGGCKNDFYIKK